MPLHYVPAPAPTPLLRIEVQIKVHSVRRAVAGDFLCPHTAVLNGPAILCIDWSAEPRNEPRPVFCSVLLQRAWWYQTLRPFWLDDKILSFISACKLIEYSVSRNLDEFLSTENVTLPLD